MRPDSSRDRRLAGSAVRRLRQSLPLLTRALIGLSDFLRMAWPYLSLAAILGMLAVHHALRRDANRYRWHALLLRIPWVGQLITASNTSRFASTLSIMLRGGVPLLAALGSGTRVIGNVVMRKAVEDAIERVREGASLSRTLRDLQKAGVWIYGFAGEAAASLYALDLKGNVALVMGSEGDGLRRLTRENCDQLVKIPMPGEFESLNVSVATGIALFEAVRQRSAGK